MCAAQTTIFIKKRAKLVGSEIVGCQNRPFFYLLSFANLSFILLKALNCLLIAAQAALLNDIFVIVRYLWNGTNPRQSRILENEAQRR